MCPTHQNLRLPATGEPGFGRMVAGGGPVSGPVDRLGAESDRRPPGDGTDGDQETRRELREVLAAATGMPCPPAQDGVSFLQRGWDSMQMARAAVAVGRAYGLRLGFRDLAGRQSNLDDLTSYITRARTAGQVDTSAGACAAGPDLPLTSGQQEILLHSLGSPEAAMDFNECLTIRLDGTVDSGRLARALDVLSMRHPAMRATIDVARGRQSIAPDPRIRLEVEDAASDEAAAARIREWAAKPFDLERGPLGRVMLVRIGTNRHELAVTMHHVTFDGWSFAVFCRELAVIYRNPGREAEDALPEPGHHAGFLRAEMAAEAAALADPAQADFWGRRLQSVPEAPRWPGQSTGDPSHAADYARLTMSGPSCAGLRAAARRAGRTLFVQLLGGYLVWLHRICQQDDLMVGIPLAGQLAGGATGVIGHGVRFLPVRSRYDGRMSAGEYLSALAGEVEDVLTHGEATAGALARCHGWGRETGGGPLIPTSFSWVPPLPEVDLGAGGRGQARIAPKSHLGVPLAVWVYQEGEQLTLKWVFQKSRFDRATVAGWLEGMENLMMKMAAEPATALRHLPMCAPDIAETLARWGQGGGPAERPAGSVIARFHEMAAAHGAKVAITDGAQSWTYAELSGQSDHLAAALAGHGVVAGDRVALLLPRSGKMIAAMLGTLRAGASYIPIDPAWPMARQMEILRAATPKAVVHHGHVSAGDHGAAWIDISDWPAPQAQDALPPMPMDPEAPAYILFTSGSTGQPKGVVVPHRGILRLVLRADWLDFSADRIFLHASVPSFDASTFEIWGALLHGGKLVVAPPAATLENLAALIRGESIDTAWFTSGLFQAMAADHPEALGRLKDLLAGGDVLPAASARALLARYPNLRLTNGYGPTENTTFTTCHRVTPGDPARAIPIGKPIHGTTVRVVDDADELVPVGGIGELLAGGDGLALGYLGDEEMTARSFVWLPVDGRRTRYYRTGDRVAWSPAGALVFHGRRDGQIKIRGHRIEPAEVETLIAKQPGVEAVKVAARGDGSAEKHLVAWVVAHADPADLRATWAKTMPTHLLPDQIVRVANFPVTAQGKIDVAALPAPVPPATGPAAADLSPTGRLLAGWWTDLLGHPVDSMDAHFFHHGGHSLLALRLFSRIHREMGLNPPLSLILQYPVLGDLARALDAMRARPDAPPVRADRPGSLVTLRDSGPGAPLVFLHGGDGGVLFARQVTDNLRPMRPVHAIGSNRLGQAAPVEETTVEATAIAYVDLLSETDMASRPVLVGYSFGGLVAWAMACRMEAAGCGPAMVVLIDTHNPEYPAMPLPMLRRLGKFWSAQSGRPWPGRVLALVRRVVAGARTHRRVLAELRALSAAGDPPPHSDLRRVQVREIHTRAMEGFRPADYHGPVVLLKARETHDKYDLAGDYHWGERARGGFSIISAPGDHLGLIHETNTAALAGVLDGILAPPPDSPAASTHPVP